MSAMRYVGDGSFHIGVPARNLTAEEAEHYREVIDGSPLYEPMDEQPDEQASGEPPAEDGEGE